MQAILNGASRCSGSLGAAEESLPTWHAALTAGNVALMKLVQNKETGPLAAGEDENASPVG